MKTPSKTPKSLTKTKRKQSGSTSSGATPKTADKSQRQRTSQDGSHQKKINGFFPVRELDLAQVARNQAKPLGFRMPLTAPASTTTSSTEGSLLPSPLRGPPTRPCSKCANNWGWSGVVCDHCYEHCDVTNCTAGCGELCTKCRPLRCRLCFCRTGGCSTCFFRCSLCDHHFCPGCMVSWHGVATKERARHCGECNMVCCPKCVSTRGAVTLCDCKFRQAIAQQTNKDAIQPINKDGPRQANKESKQDDTHSDPYGLVSTEFIVLD